jgi:phosphoribosylformimino-5-aminoimidazole carboxamide ribotide isomerase
MSFELIPAIDLLGGACVRLAQGRYDAATLYERDPARVAARFAAHAIGRIHVVDLDGAKAGKPQNREVVARIVQSAGRVPVQLGGGIRTLGDVEAALSTGVQRVVLGTVALREPALVCEAARRFDGCIVVGVDAREGRVAVEGWLETSEASALDVARRFEDAGVAAIVYTDIAKDGMLAGPNLEGTAALAKAVEIPVILSGGVGTLEDLERAAAAECGLAGAIVGRALYTGAIDLGAAVQRLGSLRCC